MKNSPFTLLICRHLHLWLSCTVEPFSTWRFKLGGCKNVCLIIEEAMLCYVGFFFLFFPLRHTKCKKVGHYSWYMIRYMILHLTIPRTCECRVHMDAVTIYPFPHHCPSLIKYITGSNATSWDMMIYGALPPAMCICGYWKQQGQAVLWQWRMTGKENNTHEDKKHHKNQRQYDIEEICRLWTGGR